MVEVANIIEADLLNVTNIDNSTQIGSLQFPEVDNKSIDAFDIGNLVKNVLKMKDVDK